MPEMMLEQSCPLCLRSDELPSMVPVELPHAMLEAGRAPIICRQCAFAIADAVDGLERTPAPEANRSVTQSELGAQETPKTEE